MKEERISTLFLPHLSERIPAGMLAMIPVKAEIEATIPTPEGSAPRWEAKRGSTGLLEIVELNMAKSPVVQRSMKGLNFIWNFPPHPNPLPWSADRQAQGERGYW